MDNTEAATASDSRAAAQAYAERGFSVVPVPARTKGPTIKGWQNLRLTAADIASRFQPDSNIGMLLGPASGGLVDVDLDCPEAVQLAPAFLPPTGLRHGRKNKPNSHFFYQVAEPPAPAKFSDPSDGACLVELRSTGQQTIVPPSVHPSGERMFWEAPGEPAQVEADALRRQVSNLSAACLLARYYPGRGSRNDFCLALAGFLVRGGMQPNRAEHLVYEVARAAGDEEADNRPAAVRSTLAKLTEAEPTRAGTSLATMLGPQGSKIVDKLRTWLHLTAGPPPVKARASMADALLQLRSGMVLFHDPDKRAFATFQVEGHRETWPIRSREFSLFLRGQHFKNAHTAINAEALQTVIDTFEAEAQFGDLEIAAHVRVAEYAGAYYLDLGNTRWEVVEISMAGWRIVNDSPVRFLRPRGMLALPTPISGGCLGDLRRFVNVRDGDDWVLIQTWLLAALRPTGPYPLLAIHGEHGSAKSTSARVLRSLIDPNTANLRAAPRDGHELMIQATNAHLLCFDNLSRISDSLSDGLSRIATGGGFSVRALYTDGEEKLFEAKRPILLNGIEELCSRPDLQDRAIVLSLPPIRPEARQDEGRLEAEFEQMRPRLLGALLDAMVEGKRTLPTVTISALPRMADFALWGVATEPALGVPKGTFLRAYKANRQATNSLTLESSPIAVEIIHLMERSASFWEGTATELLRTLNENVPEPERRARSWPANPRALSNSVRRIAPNLRQFGIEVFYSRASCQQRQRLIRLQKLPDFASNTSTTSDALENQDERTDDTDANGISSDADIITAISGDAEGSDGLDAQMQAVSPAVCAPLIEPITKPAELALDEATADEKEAASSF
ncbi:MAG: bifunctional DNA primase/polymerase [Terriglobales bacterium]